MSPELIHFNNAGASLVSSEVLEAQISYLKAEAQLGGYETAEKYTNELEAFYTHAANFINASSDEIAFTESATVAWQRAFFSIPFKEGDIILTSKIEYASNYISYLNIQKEKSVVIKVIPSIETGEVDLEALKSMISPKVKLISITHIPTNGGIVNPAEEVGLIAKDNKIIYLLDACQSVGQYPIDVKKLHCDFLTTTGRKYLRGPRGTGLLYVKKNLIPQLHPQNLDLHSANWETETSYSARSDARIFETFECSLAGKIGLSVALQQANAIGKAQIWDKVKTLAQYLREQLSEIENVLVHDLGKIKSGIVTFTASMPSPELKNKLHDRGVNVSMTFKSGTLLDMEERNLDQMIRSSVHYYNTREEVDTFISILKELL
ncbi:aminotransferase class V-fold PLP-dependent enzyme [Fulvivirga sediminis]|uniref:Aminotransferase class V-fold PLP-dependent enzyme n=1 Tax=Fulvivirga sediminis TaxID=2803949 RepID=A0A937K0P3_9BACT|nr:aminotransferase class V-fold PLP-dependent enzyme [Fulvivirga sediminis]MBL3657819.1 aminotransferase class V-fold PLP-dependent enzyme [Fulvivirga sediminis]